MTQAQPIRGVDCWVNAITPEESGRLTADFLVRVAKDYFHRDAELAHGADPWWGEAIRLLLKYPNLYMMTSAFLPKYLPPELIQFTRGQDKVMFATDFPFLPFDRAVDSARALPFRPGVLEKDLRDNALRVFQ